MKTLNDLQLELNLVFQTRAEAESDFNQCVNSEDAEEQGYAQELLHSGFPLLDKDEEKIREAVIEAGHGDQWSSMVATAEEMKFDY